MEQIIKTKKKHNSGENTFSPSINSQTFLLSKNVTDYVWCNIIFIIEFQ